MIALIGLPDLVSSETRRKRAETEEHIRRPMSCSSFPTNVRHIFLLPSLSQPTHTEKSALQV